MQFDVIVGNPPYQGAKKSGGDKGKPPTLWIKFIELCDTLLTETGVMVMVHPAMYRKPGHKLQEILYRNNRQLHIYNNAQAMQTFGASTRYDWYVIDRSYEGPTDVYFEDGTHQQLQLKPGEFVPNGSYDVWMKVGSFGHPLEVHKKPDVPTDDGEFEVVQTITKTKGVVIRQTSKKPKSYGVRKVILSETGCQALYDKEGKYGTSTNCYYVEVDSDEEGEAIVNFVNTKLCWHLTESCKWGNFRTEMCIWTYISNPYYVDDYGVPEEDIAFVYGKINKIKTP